jgi:hypothetical protein
MIFTELFLPLEQIANLAEQLDVHRSRDLGIGDVLGLAFQFVEALEQQENDPGAFIESS